LLLTQEGGSVFSVDLSTRECDGQVIAALGGELDVLDAADIANALAAVTAREAWVIVDLAALEFIDANGLAALVSVWKNPARRGEPAAGRPAATGTSGACHHRPARSALHPSQLGRGHPLRRDLAVGGRANGQAYCLPRRHPIPAGSAAGPPAIRRPCWSLTVPATAWLTADPRRTPMAASMRAGGLAMRCGARQ
jgi:ABC-type transporter Mla MlaB component